MRDVPFWLGFAALGALVRLSGAQALLHGMRRSLLGATLAAFLVYAAARMLGIGDAAAYDSTAFFGYAGALCLTLLAYSPKSAGLAAIGSGSYFIYLWHIFLILVIRDHVQLDRAGPVVHFLVVYLLTTGAIVACLLALRRSGSRRLCRWLGVGPVACPVRGLAS